ncbi:uncharacterized protein LOC142531735 [Primulina tabacum]|uniref:uncharacterized protein LOC142531735 n=1 Tax=Primulina tabacum TaxID=48773 RepID=UPI003F59E82B
MMYKALEMLGLKNLISHNYQQILDLGLQFVNIMLILGIKFEGHICKKVHVNLQAMNSEKKKLEYVDSSILHGLMNLVIGAHNKEINDVILKNTLKNCKLTSPDIQKDIVSACATETINVIIRDDGDSLFSILVDESSDVSTKEQMSFVIHYVDISGFVNERFIRIEHLTSTTSLSLKAAIDKMFSRYNLSMSKLRGQGFDGTREPMCILHTLFCPQLQLALIVVAKKNLPISNFFRVVGDVLIFVRASCKHSDLLREKHSDFIVEALERDEISSGGGLNQETTLQRAGDTCCGSH